MGCSEQTQQVLTQAAVDVIPTLIQWALGVAQGTTEKLEGKVRARQHRSLHLRCQPISEPGLPSA